MNFFSNFIIHKEKLLSNMEECKHRFNCKICAMVKANAYGLGMINVAQILNDKVDFFGVVCCEEALMLRKMTTKPILICGKYCADLLCECIKQNISLMVDCFDEMVQIQQLCDSFKLCGKIHSKINTGMNRLGISDVNEFLKMYKYIKASKYLKLEGIYTHFSTIDCDEKYLKYQCERFLGFIKAIDRKGVIIHCSGADVNHIISVDMVRIGIGIYQNVIELSSRIVKIQKVKKGEYIGYGTGCKAYKEMLVGIIPIGYADGLIRAYAENGKVIINERYYRIIGNICMDMFFVKIDKRVKENDKVIIIGGEKLHISEKDVAECCKTIDYEILTNFNKGRFNLLIK